MKEATKQAIRALGEALADDPDAYNELAPYGDCGEHLWDANDELCREAA